VEKQGIQVVEEIHASSNQAKTMNPLKRPPNQAGNAVTRWLEFRKRGAGMRVLKKKAMENRRDYQGRRH